MTTPEPERHASIPCSATTNAGKPCRSWATENGLCRLHGLSREARQENGRRAASVTNAGKAAQKAQRAVQAVEQALATLPPGELAMATQQEFHQTLVRVATAVFDGSLPPSRARALAPILKLKLDAASLEISQKLIELERRMAAQPPSGIPRRVR
jgi:hypothetical protein